MFRKLSFALLAATALFAGRAGAQNTLSIFDTVLFFDGYAGVVSSPPPPAGVIRHRNDLYARMLSSAEIATIGTTLDMKVVIKAACDNYDRIGNVNLALVPKGSATYNPDSVTRLEVGRFITPFMNKNNTPDTVPYIFHADNIASLLKETSLSASYDFWVELEVFGVPYAANTQVAGCAGRNDVFYGSLDFISSGPVGGPQTNNLLEPLLFKKTVNNYEAAATDTLGKTTKTVNFTLDSNITDAVLYLITSNHGANQGGEEYNRRVHYIYFDENLALTYKPGSTSCEPLRVYNTQANGIYGQSPRSDAQWQSFSNWCPGDTIPIRKIPLGAVGAGDHSFKITVPTAVFVDGQGYFPVSAYLQGKTLSGMNVRELISRTGGVSVYPNPANNNVTLVCNPGMVINAVSISNVLGEVVLEQRGIANTTATLTTERLPAGTYMVRVRTGAGVFVQQLQIVR